MLDATLPFNVSFEITARGLWAVLLFVTLVWLVATTVLTYHWIRYGSKSIYVMFAGLVYFTVSLGIIGWLVKIALAF